MLILCKNKARALELMREIQRLSSIDENTTGVGIIYKFIKLDYRRGNFLSRDIGFIDGKVYVIREI